MRISSRTIATTVVGLAAAAVAVAPASASAASPHSAVTQSAANHAHTKALVTRLADAVSLPAGSTLRSSAPTAALKQPAEEPGSDNLVSATRFAITKLSVYDAYVYFKNHNSRKASGGGYSESHGVITEREVTFSYPRTGYASEPGVIVSIVRYGKGSAVRIDGQAIWLPARNIHSMHAAAQTTVTVIRWQGKNTTRRFSARQMQGVVSAVNHARVSTPGDYSCPSDNGDGYRFSLLAPGGTVQISVAAGGCLVTVAHLKHRTEALEGGAIADAVEKALR